VNDSTKPSCKSFIKSHSEKRFIAQLKSFRGGVAKLDSFLIFLSGFSAG